MEPNFLHKTGQFLLAATLLVAALLPSRSQAQSTTIVISQIYGGGGNTGAAYKNDYFELYNRGATTVNLSGWTIQYASSAGTFNNSTALSGSLAPGRYYLVQESSTGSNGADLPTPNVTGSIFVDDVSGKVALASNSTQVTSPTDANVVDYVGWGSAASAYEGSGPAPATSNTTAITRTNNTDTNNNAADFAAATPTPRIGLNYYTKSGANPGATSSYGTDPAGTNGVSPSNFSGSNITYHIANGSHLLTTAWTVTGTNSKVVIDGGATLTVPSGSANYTGALDVSANGTLTQQNGSPAISFGAVDAASSIEYAQSTNYTLKSTDIPAAGFGNLILSNAVKTLPGGTVTVRGNLTLNSLTNMGATNGFSGNGSSPFTTLVLGGDLMANGTVVFGPQASRLTLETNGTSRQTLSGNGNQLKFFRLTTDAGSAGVTLADDTDLELGNTSGGGYALATGTTLAVGNNTLSFYDGGKASITTGSATTGTLALTDPGSGAGSSLVFSAAYASGGSIGTLLLSSSSVKLNNLTINLNGGGSVAARTLTLPSSVLVQGALTLTEGRLGLSSNTTLNLNGGITIGNGTILPTTTSNLAFGGSGPVNGTLQFAGTNPTIGSLTLNRGGDPVIQIGTSFRTSSSVTFNKGYILMSPGTLLTIIPTASVVGGGPTSYVNALALPLAAGNNRTQGYPLGLNGQYRQLVLTVTATGGTTYYAAVQYDGPPPTRTLPGTLNRVSSVRYFNITPVAGGTATPTSTKVKLSFGSDDYVTLLSNLRIAKSDAANNSLWDDIGGAGTATGTVASGDITSNTPTSFTIAASTDFVLANSSGTSNPLPVTLTAFAAERTAGGVAVRWTTATEHDSRSFVVERSTDGHDFAAVATVAAAGTSVTAASYAILDAAAPTTALYYRLHQLDLDGSGHYSAVVAVAGSEARTAYPNPTTDRLTVPGAAGLPVMLLDMLGRVVRQAQLDASTQLSLAGLPTGLYLLQVPGQPAQRIRKE